MSSAAKALLAEIEAFLAGSGLTATKLGIAAVNDGHLVANLRKGSSVTLKTADKVRAYMASRRRPTPTGIVSRETIPAAKRIVLIIGGGIAAYKCLELIRRLREAGIGVRAVMTRAAQEFVTPLSVGALTNDRVFTELFDLNDEREIGHIRLSREADLIVVAPATADLLAKMAGGHADDLATCVLMATDKPVLVAPAMNPRMWLNPATRRNVALLQADGVQFVGPNVGEMAERGEAGPGRLAEVPELLEAIESLLASPPPLAAPDVVSTTRLRHEGEGDTVRGGPLAGRHVLVTSGPTHEPIDPVRYIANRSSGKQGAAIAAEAARAGRRGDARQRPHQPARSGRREGGPGRDRARDAGGRARGPAGRHRRLRRRRRRLARRHAILGEDQEGRQGLAQARAGREPGYPQDHRRRSAQASGRRW